MTMVPISSDTYTNCQVCGSEDCKFHFGAFTCRACAAFFRRFVNSRKSRISCTCNVKASHACRLCRMRKCVAVGMNKCLVQLPKERSSSSDTSETDELMIESPIALRSSDRIQMISSNFEILTDLRKSLRKPGEVPGMINVYELTCVLRDDYKMIGSMIERAFPELEKLSVDEKKVLITNFYPKWSMLEAAILTVKSDIDDYSFIAPSGERTCDLEKFYNCSNEPSKTIPPSLTKVFLPYWAYNYSCLTQPIKEFKIEDFEVMSLLALMFLDAGYSNLTPSSSELCHNMRKVICRELNAFCSEKSTSELRFFDVLNLLRLIEKSEEKFQEEMELCSIHNIKMDEDFQKIVSFGKL